VTAFKSKLPEKAGIENISIDTIQGVLNYKRPGADSKVTWSPSTALRRYDLILCDEGSQYDDPEWQRLFSSIKEQPHKPFTVVVADIQNGGMQTVVLDLAPTGNAMSITDNRARAPRGNVMSITDSRARHAAMAYAQHHWPRSSLLSALCISTRRTRLDHDPPGERLTPYNKYFPNELYEGAIRGYLLNVYSGNSVLFSCDTHLITVWLVSGGMDPT